MRKFQISAICGIAVAATILGIVVINISQPSNANEFSPRIIHTQEPIMVPPSPRLNNTIYGSTVSDVAAAQGIAGYKVDVPSYLPSANSLRMTKVNVENKNAILVYSPTPITDRITVDELLSAKGILIIHSQTEPGFDSEQWIKQNVAGAPDVRKAITINGMRGMATEYSVVVDPNGAELPIPAKVVFFRGTTQIVITAKMSPDELVKVAESMK